MSRQNSSLIRTWMRAFSPFPVIAGAVVFGAVGMLLSCVTTFCASVIESKGFDPQGFYLATAIMFPMICGMMGGLFAAQTATTMPVRHAVACGVISAVAVLISRVTSLNDALREARYQSSVVTVYEKARKEYETNQSLEHKLDTLRAFMITLRKRHDDSAHNLSSLVQDAAHIELSSRSRSSEPLWRSIRMVHDIRARTAQQLSETQYVITQTEHVIANNREKLEATKRESARILKVPEERLSAPDAAKARKRQEESILQALGWRLATRPLFSVLGAYFGGIAYVSALASLSRQRSRKRYDYTTDLGVTIETWAASPLQWLRFTWIFTTIVMVCAPLLHTATLWITDITFSQPTAWGLLLPTTLKSWLVARFTWQQSARCKMEDFPSLQRRDHRSPALYLRQFESDGERLDGSFWQSFWTGAWEMFLRPFPETALRESCGHVAPLLGCGRPGESFPPDGCARIYTHNDDWKSLISDILRKSRLVVIRTGASQALEWEVRETLAHCRAEQVILYVPRRSVRKAGIADGYDEFRAWAAKLFPNGLPRAVEVDGCFFVYFHGAQWSPCLLIPGRSIVNHHSLAPVLNAVSAHLGFRQFRWLRQIFAVVIGLLLLVLIGLSF